MINLKTQYFFRIHIIEKFIMEKCVLQGVRLVNVQG
jgi:hypothetical protein